MEPINIENFLLSYKKIRSTMSLPAKFIIRVSLIGTSMMFLSGCQTNSSTNDDNWQSLFNGKDLSGWDTYLGPAYDTIQNKRDTLSIPGLNQDPNNVFSVVNVDNAPAIRISGSHNGGISTLSEFENYHLTLEFKWGTLKWHPRKDRKRDSGLLYHAVGPHGADYGFWMRSQELQIQEGDCGDYWGVAGGIMDIPANGDAPEKYVYDPTAALLDFSGTSPHGRRCIKNPDAEKTSGEWNRVEIYCHGDTAVHIINGVVNMVLYHSRQLEGGKEIPLTKGKIQIQSEGAEIYYRNLQLQSVAKIPEHILKGLNH
jgi:hypothetical protein